MEQSNRMSSDAEMALGKRDGLNEMHPQEEDEVAMGHAEEQTRFRPRLVIFDKDGTLIDFITMWARWTEDLGSKMIQEELIEEGHLVHFYSVLGYDKETNKVTSKSPLCCSPMGMLLAVCIDWLVDYRQMCRILATEKMQRIWSKPNVEQHTKPLTNLDQLFSFLKEREIKIAVCTTDDRDITEQTLRFLGVDHHVDLVLGGDETHVRPKPSADQIHYICQQLEIDNVRDVIMVGDTITDMRMGKNSGVGLTVGVMHGASSLEDLSEHADFLIPTMNNFSRIVSKFCP